MKRILLFSVLCAATAFGVTVTPRITNDCLINPGMGLVFYHFANRYWAYGAELEPGDTMESIPGTSVVYLRVLWSNIEAEEGVYRWDILDSVARKRGRALATHSVLLKPGTYDLAVSVGSRQGTPVIALPLEGAVGGTRRYVVGKMKVVE